MASEATNDAIATTVGRYVVHTDLIGWRTHVWVSCGIEGQPPTDALPGYGGSYDTWEEAIASHIRVVDAVRRLVAEEARRA